MNKIFTLISFFCLLFSLNVSAQKSRLGIKTGVNFAWQSNSMQGSERSPLVSTHLTLFTEMRVFKNLFIQPGMSLQGKGVSNGTNMTEGSRGRVNMMYMEIPINILYKFAPSQLGRLVVGGGPYAGLGLTGRESNGSRNVFRAVEGSNGYGNTDFGFNVLAGTELSSRFSLSLQQSIGLDNVAPEAYTVQGPADEPMLVPQGNIKNRVSSISIGYRF